MQFSYIDKCFLLWKGCFIPSLSTFHGYGANYVVIVKHSAGIRMQLCLDDFAIPFSCRSYFVVQAWGKLAANKSRISGTYAVEHKVNPSFVIL